MAGELQGCQAGTNQLSLATYPWEILCVHVYQSIAMATMHDMCTLPPALPPSLSFSPPPPSLPPPYYPSSIPLPPSLPPSLPPQGQHPGHTIGEWFADYTEHTASLFEQMSE